MAESSRVSRAACLSSQSCVLQAPRVDDSTSEGKPYFLRCYLQQKLTKNAKFALRRGELRILT